MRSELIDVVGRRSAHFASNLGVVELCLALHLSFDFTRDRLIWDTGHQIYPHKLITGRASRLPTIRTKGGLMGYPNPAESPYDLFMTGHAGCSVSSVLGLKAGDVLTHYDGKEVVDLAHFISGRDAEKPGDPKRELRVRRGDEELTFQVAPGKMSVDLRDRFTPDIRP